MASNTGKLRKQDSRGSVVIPFGEWRKLCLKQFNHENKQEIRNEAKRLFHSLISSTQMKTTDGTILTTKSSHNEALARMIQELGPCLASTSELKTTTNVNRVWALWCLCGAVEGCRDRRGKLSRKVVELLGTFLKQLCGPLEEDDAEGTEEIVRDSAMLCLAALCRSVHEDADESHVCCRLDLAQMGVEKRCALPEGDDDGGYSNGYDGYQVSNDIRGGLSNLPRSRRSLCFDLVLAAVDGIQQQQEQKPVVSTTGATMSDLVKFVSFAANCLQGESDPRCLQQLLNLLSKIQVVFLPFFKRSDVPFPILNLFDAVAPYYPIQFTPPPNDTHGITRSGLGRALLNVLCCTTFDDKATNAHDTMLNLSAGLFLERLLPTEEAPDDVPVADRIETIEDLSNLLVLSRDGSNTNGASRLDFGTVGELTAALVTTHAAAATAASPTTDKGRQNKLLADKCRSLVSGTASELEISSQKGDTQLWKIFVADTVRKNSPLLSEATSSLTGRTTIAYLACLAASGGPKTLRACLQECIPRLIEALNFKSGDEEKMTAAAYGLGAFFSSVQVCYERGRSRLGAVYWSPHPLQPYGGKVLEGLRPLFGSDAPSASVNIAAIRAMDSLLNVTPLSVIGDDIEAVGSFIQYLVTVTSSVGENGSELEHAASVTLGSIIGQATLSKDAESSSVPSILREHGPLVNKIQNEILAKLLESTTRDDSSSASLETLVCASKESPRVAASVVEQLTVTLAEALKGDDVDVDGALLASKNLGKVLRGGGQNVLVAFHQIDNEDVVDMALLRHLAGDANSSAPPKTLRSQSSLLELPASTEDHERTIATVEFAHKILPDLLPAYSYAIPNDNLITLVKEIEAVLPPLSEQQNARLCILIPVLSTTLRYGQRSDRLDKELPTFFSTLVAFAVESDNDSKARASAMECSWTIVTAYHPGKVDCWVRKCLSTNVLPQLASAINNLSKSMEGTDERVQCLITVVEMLEVLSSLCGAAACRGKSSTSTSTEVSGFLVHLACSKVSKVPFVTNEGLATFSMAACAEDIGPAAASSFGAMMSISSGGPFWRQRLSHKACKIVLESIDELKDSRGSMAPITFGQAGILCHLVCSGSLAGLGQTAMEKICYEIFRFLNTLFPSQDGFISIDDEERILMKELTLGAFVKLMVYAPDNVNKYIPVVLVSFLRAFPPEERDEGTQGLRFKLLALQGLMIATTMEGGTSRLLKLKPAVEALLVDHLNHPSYLLRKAVIQTINTWAVIT